MFTLKWLSIRWANHVIDFHPVTFSSGLCEAQTPAPPPPLPIFFCCLVSTPPHIRALYYNNGDKYDLCFSFRTHVLLLVVISLTKAAHKARWTPGHYQVAITAITIKPGTREHITFFLSNLNDGLICSDCCLTSHSSHVTGKGCMLLLLSAI